MKNFLVILMACSMIVGCSLDHDQKPKGSHATTEETTKGTTNNSYNS